VCLFGCRVGDRGVVWLALHPPSPHLRQRLADAAAALAPQADVFLHQVTP
jgi:hypothetical protein